MARSGGARGGTVPFHFGRGKAPAGRSATGGTGVGRHPGRPRLPVPETPPRPSVLITTEGTYPFEGGGVTTWADVVIRGLPEVDVHLLAVTGSTALELDKELPPHVRSVQAVPLFGAAEPTEFTRHGEPFATTVLRRARTTPAAVRRHFVPLLKRLMAALEHPERAGPREAELVRDLNHYFVRFDHRASFRSEAAWTAFRDTVLAQEAGSDVETTLGDLVQGLRWLYSFLLPITMPVPRTDVVHATLAGFAGLAGVISKLNHGTPFVVTDHGIYLRERYIAMSASADSFFLKRFLLRLVHLVSRVCYVTADQVSPVCNHNARWEQRMGVTPDRIRTIYNGIDTDLFKPPASEPQSRRPTVVTAARVFPLKDIETLIRACDVTRRRVPDVHFVVYGANWVDKPYTDRCEALIDELGVRGNFTFAGYHDTPVGAVPRGRRVRALVHLGGVPVLRHRGDGVRPPRRRDRRGRRQGGAGGRRGHRGAPARVRAAGRGPGRPAPRRRPPRRPRPPRPPTRRRGVRRRADARRPPRHVPALGGAHQRAAAARDGAGRRRGRRPNARRRGARRRGARAPTPVADPRRRRPQGRRRGASRPGPAPALSAGARRAEPVSTRGARPAPRARPPRGGVHRAP